MFTDHLPLTKLATQPFLSKRQARWLERLNELPLVIKYREGPLNVVADTLSRIPQREQLHLGDADAAVAAAYLR